MKREYGRGLLHVFTFCFLSFASIGGEGQKLGLIGPLPRVAAAAQPYLGYHISPLQGFKMGEKLF